MSQLDRWIVGLSVALDALHIAHCFNQQKHRDAIVLETYGYEIPIYYAADDDNRLIASPGYGHLCYRESQFVRTIVKFMLDERMARNP